MGSHLLPKRDRRILGRDANVEVATTPAALTEERLRKVDVVINNSLFHRPTKAQFDALFAFVERGGGFVRCMPGT